MDKELPSGLSSAQVAQSRQQHGSNALNLKEDWILLHVLKDIVTEPMFILLILACAVYFFAGENREAVIMLLSILLVAGISLFQEYRSKNAVQALKKIAAAKATLVREGKEIKIAAEEIVTGDILLLEEGEIVAADGLIIAANDFSLNESVLTGESYSVQKSAGNNSTVYKGTLVTSGSAVIEVSAVGNKTMFGKIGLSLQEITIVKTPLQLQIKSFVKSMVWIGAVAFATVVIYNYIRSGDLLHSFLQGLTLAMSVLPEEIPVAFSTFQALGAFRLLKQHIIVKQPQYVETLGSATVICSDKTGTLTQNRMSIQYLYDARTAVSYSPSQKEALPVELTEYAMWASETTPFDPMEKAIHELYSSLPVTDKRTAYRQVHEYPVGGNPPMMTHIFSSDAGDTIIAAKGAPEAIMRQSNLAIHDLKRIEEQCLEYARRGYRVLGVGKGSWEGKKWPVAQEEFGFELLGLVVFYDPPKENIRSAIETFHQAGISVKMITGDYAETALAIAAQAGLNHNREVLTGKEVIHLSKEALQQKVKSVNIYARMFPEAKLRVIDALKENNEVVAMTGDGVNDGPALKAAHIGIAMGKRGSEVARNAASLILTDDDLSHMTEAVALGRKIYDNLKKAIRYIVSIHIPIILIVMLPLLLGWKFTGIFTPVHVIFLELIMGPTCSIIYENEPMEAGTMLRLPRNPSAGFLSLRQLLISIIQGLIITAACLGIGFYVMQSGASENMIRTVIFITLLFANIFLTLVNRSFRFTIFTTIRYPNTLIPVITMITLLFIAAVIYIPFLSNLFGVTVPGSRLLVASIITAFVAVIWIEPVKTILKGKLD